MKYRKFGSLDWKISEIGLGCWQIGADWGNVSEDKASEVLKSSFENGVNFFDTADVYGDGRSEKLVGKFIKSISDRVYVATKAGRRLNPHNAEFDNKSEEVKIILPALKKLKKKNIKISGPFAADTFFIEDFKKYDVTVGMFHDQVIAPFKTLFGFEAINMTL